LPETGDFRAILKSLEKYSIAGRLALTALLRMFTGMQRAKPGAQCAVAHKRRSDKALRPANM
jgi:hypothetical protein